MFRKNIWLNFVILELLSTHFKLVCWFFVQTYFHYIYRLQLLILIYTDIPIIDYFSKSCTTPRVILSDHLKFLCLQIKLREFNIYESLLLWASFKYYIIIPTNLFTFWDRYTWRSTSRVNTSVRWRYLD